MLLYSYVVEFRATVHVLEKKKRLMNYFISIGKQ